MSVGYDGGIGVILRKRQVVSKDRQNNDLYEWVDTPILGCIFAPKGSIELVGKTGDSVVTTDTLYPPWSTDLSPDDEVVIYGITYQVDGDVSRWENPWTGDQVLRVDLKRVTG